jgi:hypothetical protein
VRTLPLAAIVAALVVLVPASALAQQAAPDDDDGYCDFVIGSASATAATLVAPELFGQFGHIEQTTFAVTLDEPSNLRVLAGVRYSLTNIYSGVVTTSRARAECRRHNALRALQNAADGLNDVEQALRAMPRRRALSARAKVLDGAVADAERILKHTLAQLDAQQTTAQAALVTRMRVEELRTLLRATRRELAELPAMPERRALDNLFSAFRAADAEVEKQDGKLRTARAYNLNLRAGVDRYLNGPAQDLRYFAVAELSINLGGLWLGAGNRRSAAGRKRYARHEPDLTPMNAIDVTQAGAALELDVKAIQQTTALVAELEAQYKVLANASTEDSRRFRETVWFEMVKAKAELSYLQEQVQATRELLRTVK